MIALASDHAGFEYKEKTKNLLVSLRLEFIDLGTGSAASTDYPDFAHAAAETISSGQCDRAILFCGTGIGMSITANKHRGIRAAACESVTAAAMSRKHNDANVLCVGARLVSWETAENLIRTFLSTPFEAGRHDRRVQKIHSLTGC